MTTYAKFTEHNEWEGETWRFYIPVAGNESDLKRLSTTLTECDFDYDEGYELDLTPLLESEVDILVKHSDGGYMSDHNKLVGVLVLTDDVFTALKRIADGEDGVDDPFYKGEIRAFMKELTA